MHTGLTMNCVLKLFLKDRGLVTSLLYNFQFAIQLLQLLYRFCVSGYMLS
jgi:hypothetical protein